MRAVTGEPNMQVNSEAHSLQKSCTTWHRPLITWSLIKLISGDLINEKPCWKLKIVSEFLALAFVAVSLPVIV